MNVADSRIALPGTRNVRDLGGFPAADGREVSPGRLYRAEALAHPGSTTHAHWDEQFRADFSALAVRTVIDLRSPAEVAHTPSAWPAATGGEVVALPISAGAEGSDTDYVRQLLDRTISRFDEQDLARLYRQLLDTYAGTFGKAAAVLAEPRRLPVLVHCSAGKDRTGLLVALVLSVLGTPRETVLADYALTEQLGPVRVRSHARQMAAAGLAEDDVRGLLGTPAAAMQEALAHLDSAYGGATDYLTGPGGLSSEQLLQLRDNLLGRRRQTP